ncbi:MAG: hypothetical protein HC883_00220 [Bdellovibrionaceae bacterium]|nr:hypothetical protein [Pseudobdellovibrionaceae bacterium]
MPILAVDQFGRIYETSPDREDGLGYGGRPETVDQQDLTLGSAYLNAQNRRRQELVRSHQSQKIQDHIDEREAAVRAYHQAQARRQIEIDERRNDDHRLRDALTKKAVAMGCSCEYSTGMSGNVLSANGQSGWAGMSRDQKTLHHALSGMGSNTAYLPDPMEVRQARMNAEANRILRLKARR